MDNADMEARIREEFMKEIKKFVGYYKDFELTIIPVLEKFAKVCKKRSLAVKLHNLLVESKSLYLELSDIYKTKSWISLDDLQDKVLSFDFHLDTIQKEYMILTTNNLNENNDEKKI